MSEKILKLAQRINEVVPEISVDDVMEMWKEIDEPQVKKSAPACKYMFLKGKNANIQCKIKVKGDGEYCSKHKPK